MHKAVIAVYKMVIGGKADKYFLACNYAEMNKVMIACKQGLITDLETIKALCNLSEESTGKECYIVTKKEFDRITRPGKSH